MFVNLPAGASDEDFLLEMAHDLRLPPRLDDERINPMALAVICKDFDHGFHIGWDEDLFLKESPFHEVIILGSKSFLPLRAERALRSSLLLRSEFCVLCR